MILLIDNYDSFSYNLYQLIGQVNRDIEVYRNDKITADEIKDLNPEDLLSDEESISESGRGLPICKSLCEATDGEFSARTNKDETSWTYLAKINY